jgi:hypothetical protein
MGFFYLSTQRHYRRLILLLLLPHVSVIRLSSARNTQIGRTTETCSSGSSKINLQ